ncbi:MAG: hypothetical protein HZB92_00475 [Euryarchaeota archaeon]|nr:hypothetical protein [Euryarchaeota archaeon]
MRGGELYSLNSATFVLAYKRGKIDMDVVARERKVIRKPGKGRGAHYVMR